MGTGPIDETAPGRDSDTGSGERHAIGVPDEYEVERAKRQNLTGRGLPPAQVRAWETIYTNLEKQGKGTYTVKPQYFDGDDYIPANWPSNQIWQIQQALAKVGFLTSAFTRNTWDTATRNAYRQLLGIANATGVSADQALSELLDTSGGDVEGQGRWTVDEFGNVVRAGEGEAPPPLVTRTTDPAALRQTFRRAIIELLGEGWSQEQINNMVKAYNQMEIARQTEEYNLMYGLENEKPNAAGGLAHSGGGSVMSVPSPEEFIEQQVLTKDPAQAQVHDALGFTEDFMQAASSPAWGVG